MKASYPQGKTIFRITDFGAVGDGVANATAALRQALEACHRHGNGVVIVPAGTFFIEPLYLKSNVHLHLEKGATLLGSPRAEDYPEWSSRRIHLEGAPYNARALFYAEDEENITLSGEGTIHGQGNAFYDGSDPSRKWWPVPDRAARPGRMLLFALCRNVEIRSLTFQEAPAWTFWMFGCEDVRFHGVTIRTNPNAINTDGIDIDACRNVRIAHCDISTGDDAIVLRNIWRIFNPQSTETSRTGLGFGLRPCEHVTVENCRLQSWCNAIRISYLRDEAIRNATFRNLEIVDSWRGIICQIPVPMQTPEGQTGHPVGRGPLVENIHFSNITVEARQPLWFYVAPEAILRRVGNVVFENVTFRGSHHSLIRGNEAVPGDQILLRNVSFTLGEPETTTLHNAFHDQETATHLHLGDLRGISLQNVHFGGDLPAHAGELPVIRLERVASAELAQVTNGTRFPLRREA